MTSEEYQMRSQDMNHLSTASMSMHKSRLDGYYNRIVRPLGVIDTTNSWNYTLAAWHGSDAANAGNCVEVITGYAEANVRVHVQGGASNSSAILCVVGVGVDATTTNSAQIRFGGAFATVTQPCRAEYFGFPSAGYHSYRWIEYSAATGTTTWYGDNGGVLWQTGMYAESES